MKQATQSTQAQSAIASTSTTTDTRSSNLKSSLRGMSYDDQVSTLSPDGGAGGDGAAATPEDPNAIVGEKDTPGVLYSNTSKTNLNKDPKTTWMSRLGFNLGTHYVSSVTFTDLVLAGYQVKAPPAKAAGTVKVPKNANTTDIREYDYIKTPGGDVTETGSASFAIRGGKDVGGPVTLEFANNGGLNLARLARAAYELAVAKGCVVADGAVDYKGQTFALGCKVQMGNEVDDENAREYGYVGEFPSRWIDEKVTKTLEILCAAVTVAANRGMTTQAQGGNVGMIHPENRTADVFQTNYKELNARGGMAIKANTREIDPANFSGNETIQSRGTGLDQRAWMTNPDDIAQAAEDRLTFTWAPGGDWRGHPTYIKECPDFTAIIKGAFKGATYTESVPGVKAAMAKIGAALLLAPMNHDLITDADLQKKVVDTNRNIIKASFAKVADPSKAPEAQRMDFDVKKRLETLKDPKADTISKPADKPVEDETPNGEGLVLVRSWEPMADTK